MLFLPLLLFLPLFFVVPVLLALSVLFALSMLLLVFPGECRRPQAQSKTRQGCDHHPEEAGR